MKVPDLDLEGLYLIFVGTSGFFHSSSLLAFFHLLLAEC